MKTLKYSRQRESIKASLMSRKDHPTADAVYASIREEPACSLTSDAFCNIAAVDLSANADFSCSSPRSGRKRR